MHFLKLGKLPSPRSKPVLHQLFSTLNARSNKMRADAYWETVVEDAEKVIGGNSFRNLQWLLNDEITNIACHFEKVMTTAHPMVKAARYIIENNSISWGLIVTLFSKATEQKTFLEAEKYLTPGVLHSQYVIAKVTEMLKMSVTLHKEIVSLNYISRDMNYGNKITILSGDYLLCECLKELANLGDHSILEIMSSGMRDLSASQFIGTADSENEPLPAKPNGHNGDISYLEEFSCDPMVFPNALGNATAEWTLRTILGGGSLLGKGCLSSLKLANYPKSIQNIGFSFGKNFALVYQAYLDLNEFSLSNTGPFSLVSAPFLFQLQDDSSLYDEIARSKGNVWAINFDFLRDAVMNGSGIQKTLQLQKEYLNAALKTLEIFEYSDAQAALKNLICLIDKN